MIGQDLYQLSQYDIAKADYSLQRIAQFTDTLAASAAIVTATNNIPRDKAFMLLHASGVWVAGAAQVLTDLRATVEDDVGNNLSDFLHFRNAAGVAEGSVEQDLRIIALPGERLAIAATFNAGAAANRVQFFFSGYLMPRGNWQRGTI